MKKMHSLVCAAALLAPCGAAMAQQYFVRVGAVHISPNSIATDAVGPMVPPPPSGIGMQVQSASTLLFSVARSINDNLEVEFVAGYPPTHASTADLSPHLPAHVLAYQGLTLAKVRQIAPTVFLNYKFGAPTSRWRPSVGLGVNYTNFDKRTSTAAGNALNGGPTHIHMSDSWGLAAQIGLSYRVDERWTINAGLTTARVKTRMTATTAGVARTMDIRFRPAVFSLTAGYAF